MGFFDKLVSKKPAVPPFDFGVIQWGTISPIVVKVAGNFAQLRAFGSVQLHPKDHAQFLALFGEPPNVEKLDELTSNVKNLVVQKLTDAVGAISLNAGDLQSILSRKNEIATTIQSQLSEEMGQFGLEIKSLSVDNIQPL